MGSTLTGTSTSIIKKPPKDARRGNKIRNEEITEEQKSESGGEKQTLTSAKQTLVSLLRSVLALFKAFLVFSTGTLIMGVLMLELATIRISLSLRDRWTYTESETPED